MILLIEVMDKTNRAIDSGDVQVIIEAAAEFEQGVADFKKGLEGVLQIANIDSTKLGSLGKLVQQAQQSVKDVKTSELPDSFSFKQAMALRTGKGDKETNVTPIALAASKISTAVEGTKEAILVIAEWMENYSDIFGISSNGIEIKAPFDKNIEDISLAAIAGKSGIEIAKLFAGPQMGDGATDENGDPVTDDEQKVYAHYREGIDALAEKTKKETAQATSDFLSSLEAMGKELAGLHQTCVKAISDIEVDDGVQQIVRGQGWFKKLFSGTDDYKVSPKEAAEICGKSEKDTNTGLFSLSMQQLGEVVQGFITISGDVVDQATSAIEGVAQQGDQVLDPNEEQEQALETATEALGDDPDKGGELIARLEDEELVDPESPEITDVSLSNLIQVVTDMGVNDDAVEEVAADLAGEEAADDEGGGYKEDILKDMGKDFTEYTTNWAKENGVRNEWNTEESNKIRNIKSNLEKIMDEQEPTENGLIPKDAIDSEMISDKWQISPQDIAVEIGIAENKIFSRWGVLAGIIKG